MIVSHAYFSKVARVTVKENTFLIRSHLLIHPEQVGLQINTDTTSYLLKAIKSKILSYFHITRLFL